MDNQEILSAQQNPKYLDRKNSQNGNKQNKSALKVDYL